MMSRAYTDEEMLDMFMSGIRNNIKYWALLPDKTIEDRISGAIFSTLCMIDGVSGAFPCCLNLVCDPHQEDKQYCIDNDENYVEDGMVINNTMLHELLYERADKKMGDE